MSDMMIYILDTCLGEARKHNESTGQIAYDCPECSLSKGMDGGDGKGNFEVNYKKNVYKCWSCAELNGTKGSIIKLIKHYGNDKLLEEYKIFKPDVFMHEPSIHGVDKLPDEFIPLSKVPDKPCKHRNQALTYLYKRRIGDEMIKKYDIGYCIYGKYRFRVIIPSKDEFGQINFFVSRAYGKNNLKYLNPQADKTKLIFNEDKIDWDSTVYLVEGVFDHIVLPNSIPMLGKFITTKLFDRLQERANAYVTILLDDDAYEDGINLYKKLNVGNLYSRIRIIKMPQGFDISLVNERYGTRGLKKILKSRTRLKEPII